MPVHKHNQTEISSIYLIMAVIKMLLVNLKWLFLGLILICSCSISMPLVSFLSSMVSNRENPTNQLQQQQWILKKKKQNLLATPDSNDIG